MLDVTSRCQRYAKEIIVFAVFVVASRVIGIGGAECASTVTWQINMLFSRREREGSIPRNGVKFDNFLSRCGIGSFVDHRKMKTGRLESNRMSSIKNQR